MGKLRIIDTHTHLCDPSFDSDLDAVLNRAEKVGIVSILTVSETLDDARKNLVLSEKHSTLHPLAGLYPKHLDLDQCEAMIQFIQQHRDQLVGIGEVGLDFWVVKEASDREMQKAIFIRSIELSKKLDLPLNVHSRSAGRHVIDLLLRHNARKVQLHAFDGKASATMSAVEAGYFFSIPPSVVHSRQKQKLVEHLPLSCMLAETDSPVLGPIPGERNEPKHVQCVIESIAQIKGIQFERVAEIVFQNTVKLYGHAIC